uniref:DUF559 domain-containing protein n=1 Tax=Thermorudis sp. TaxID=1969470 RepID=A0A7C2WR41_9BACT
MEPRSRQEERRTGRRQMRREPTAAERRLWAVLRGRRLDGWKFRRQHPVGPYVVDFACLEAGLVVELDGAIHQAQADYDAARDAYLAACGFAVLRLPNEVVLERLPEALEAIRGQLARRQRSAGEPPGVSSA